MLGAELFAYLSQNIISWPPLVNRTGKTVFTYSVCPSPKIKKKFVIVCVAEWRGSFSMRRITRFPLKGDERLFVLLFKLFSKKSLNIMASAASGVDPDLVGLPTRAASVPLDKVFSSEFTHEINKPGVFDLPEHKLPGVIPRGCSMTTEDNWLKLARTMLLINMGHLTPLGLGPVVRGRRIFSKLFSVPKGDLQRLVSDRRPRNFVEKSILQVLEEAGLILCAIGFEQSERPPYAPQLADFLLVDGQGFRLHGDDLKDYFFQLL